MITFSELFSSETSNERCRTRDKAKLNKASIRISTCDMDHSRGYAQTYLQCATQAEWLCAERQQLANWSISVWDLSRAVRWLSLLNVLRGRCDLTQLADLTHHAVLPLFRESIYFLSTSKQNKPKGRKTHLGCPFNKTYSIILLHLIPQEGQTEAGIEIFKRVHDIRY